MESILPDFPSHCQTAEIERLVDALYLAKRELDVALPYPNKEGSHCNPHFVLIARSALMRHELETRIFAYFAKKYGFEYHHNTHPCKTSSTFCFPNGITITIIDLFHESQSHESQSPSPSPSPG